MRRLGTDDNAAMSDARSTPSTPSKSARASIAPLALAVLTGIALLGNGLKALVTSSVLVSEAQFAAFLRFSAEHVAVLMEVIVGGMVIALALCPLFLSRMRARTLAIAACVAAAGAFATFAVVDLAGPAEWAREVAAFGCLALGAGALALLAPTAQALVTLAPTASLRTSLTAVWTGATPAGFLVAPQMVKYLVPALGLGYYFLALAALPLVLLSLLVMFALAMPATDAAQPLAPPIAAGSMSAFLAAVIAFEAWSTLGSVTAYDAPLTWAALMVCVLTAVWLKRAVRRDAPPTAFAGSASWLLGALFVLEMPTTGFFDTAYLVERGFAQSFIADRATLAAAAQILGAVAAGGLVHRRPAAEATLRYAFAAILTVGLIALAAYPWLERPQYFLWPPAIEGFGASGLTLLICLAVVRDAARHPLRAALPSIAIMLGTEFGLELLQLVFAAARAWRADVTVSFGVLFVSQVLCALVVLVLLRIATRREA
jgi:hypothetical protein